MAMLENFPIAEQVAATEAICRRSLDLQFEGLRLAGAPHDPTAWCRLLSRLPDGWWARRRLRALRLEAVRRNPQLPPGTVERYALLQAFLASLRKIAGFPVHDSIKRFYCSQCVEIADPAPQRAAFFRQGLPPFDEMAKIASLRRLPAGQLSFDVTRFPRSWLLRIHPANLPAAIGALSRQGLGPVVAPHLSHWRANPLFVLKGENERSLRRIAKCMELRPDIGGLVADSWLYSAEVGNAFPHLAWQRSFFLDHGAFLVEMETATPDSGFLVGSAKRRQLWEQGRFRPRRTLVLWDRHSMLSWAAAQPDVNLAEDRDPPHPHRGIDAGDAAGPRHRLQNGRIPWLNADTLLRKYPKPYIALTLVAPSLAAALTASAHGGTWSAMPAFLATFAFMWVFQYFILQ